MKKKLFKSEKDRKICGVCGGIAEYFDIDSTIVRLIWAVTILFYFSGLVAYVIAALIMPDESDVSMVIKKSRKKDN